MNKTARSILFCLLFAMLYACSDDSDTPNYERDCPPDPTLPGCVDYCDTVDSTASWCDANADAGDAGNVDPGDAGDAGDAGVDAGPCDGGCDTGVCDTDSDTCVPCLGDGDCTDGVCLAGATTADNACVTCRSDDDCDSADAAKCDLTTNECVACDDSEQCSNVTDAPICNDGTCIGCLPQNEATDCPGTFCDRATLRCTQDDVGSAGGCDTCTSNADCAAEHRCVELEFEGNPRGSYCMPLFDPAEAMCPRTYGFGAQERPTMGGGMETVCLIKEANVTCEAIDQFEDSCPNGNECTADGARCEMINNIPTCTYTCTGNRDCRTGVDCGGSEPLYCGGPS